jgi:hypothetical protein
MKKTMKGMLIAFSALALFSAGAPAQISKAARGNVGHANVAVPPSAPTACSPCLRYSGDNDAANPNWDALANYNNLSIPFEAEAWVPFIAASDGNPAHKLVLVSSITFNEIMSNSPDDLTGITYAFRTGVSSGNGGTLKQNGTCNTTSVVATGNTPNGYTEYAFTCFPKKFAVKIPVGTIYWVDILPTFTSSTGIFLSNAIDVPDPSQLGWSDDFYNSFFNSAYFSNNFVPATSVDIGMQEFSVSIAGTYVN